MTRTIIIMREETLVLHLDGEVCQVVQVGAGLPWQPHAKACKEESVGGGETWKRGWGAAGKVTTPVLESQVWGLGLLSWGTGSHRRAGSRLSSGCGGLEAWRPGKRLGHGSPGRE